MNESFRCGDEGALVAYLYDECETIERDAIAAHLTACAVCTEQLRQWSWTREQVRTWAPPDAALGFQITARDAAVTPRLVADAPRAAVPWWRAPLPAWAQAAAAVLVFGAGLSVGMARGGGSAPAPGPESTSVSVMPVTTPVPPGVSPAQLAALEERLRAEFGQERAPAGPVTAAGLTAAARADLLGQVRAIVDEKAADERVDFTERQLDLERRVEGWRRADRAQFLDYQNEASQEIRQHREVLNTMTPYLPYLQRVSQPGQPGR